MDHQESKILAENFGSDCIKKATNQHDRILDRFCNCYVIRHQCLLSKVKVITQSSYISCLADVMSTALLPFLAVRF